MGNVNKKLISITGSSALFSAVNHAQKTLVSSGDSKAFELNDGVVSHSYLNEGYKEAYKYLNKLYVEGLIDPEFATDGQNETSAKCTSPDKKVAFTQTWEPNNFNNAFDTPVYTAIEPLVGIDGEKHWVRRMYRFDLGVGIITKDCEDPSLALEWLDANTDPEMSLQARYGMIGTWLEDAGDGTYNSILTDKGTLPVAQDLVADVPHYFGGTIQEEMYDKIVNSVPNGKLESCNIYEPYINDLDECFPIYSLWTVDEIQKTISINNDVKTYFLQMQVDFIINGNVDERWDEYVETLENMGINTLTEVAQGVYNRSQQ